MPRPASLSPDLMMTFVSIVRSEGDATQAAEALAINQPSMSKRLAFLQHSGRILRKPWLERVGKRWRLTPEGRRVLPAVEELVHRYRLLTESIDEMRPGVVVGVGPELVSRLIRDSVSRFLQANPRGTFRLVSRTEAARVEGVANGSLDLACVRLTPEEIFDLAHRPLHVQDLYEDPLVLAASSTVPGYEEFQSLSDRGAGHRLINRFPLLLPEPDSGLRRDFDRKCRDAGVLDRLRIAGEIGPWAASLDLARDGVGVAMVPRSVLHQEDEIHFRPLPARLNPANIVRVICRKRPGTDDLDLTEEGQEFLNALREATSQVGE